MSKRAMELIAGRSERICAVATASTAGEPAAALVFYAPLPDGRLLISTHTTSHKWRNLLENAEVALVFGWTFAQPHIQVSGRAELIPPGHADFERLGALYYRAFPEAAALRDSATAFLIVRPSWARITEFQPGGPPKVEEGLVGQ